jgi:hypothetical protein
LIEERAGRGAAGLIACAGDEPELSGIPQPEAEPVGGGDAAGDFMEVEKASGPPSLPVSVKLTGAPTSEFTASAFANGAS